MSKARYIIDSIDKEGVTTMGRAKYILSRFNEEDINIDLDKIAYLPVGYGPKDRDAVVDSIVKKYNLPKETHKKLFEIIAKYKKVVNTASKSLMRTEFEKLILGK